MEFQYWAVHEVRDQGAPWPGTGLPLASQASPAESSATGSPPAAWSWPRPVVSPEPLPPPAACPPASQRPAGHCGSPPQHNAALTQTSSLQRAPLHPPVQVDHLSPPPDRTLHIHYLGCRAPLEPGRLGGSPDLLQACPEQWRKSLHRKCSSFQKNQKLLKLQFS